jgi:hypothetical protein
MPESEVSEIIDYRKNAEAAAVDELIGNRATTSLGKRGTATGALEAYGRADH